MSFETNNGQPMAVKLIQRWLAKNTTQPLLFYGPQGTGKRALALETARALNCQAVTPAKAGVQNNGLDSGFRRNDDIDACQKCQSCKKISSGNHPDVRIVDLAFQAAARGEPVEKQLTLKIETVLEERKRLYQTPNEGAWKVSIFDEAHKFTPDAANVLLKVLEEPPSRTAIFLLTEYRDRIFPTLISRCQTVRFQSKTDPEQIHSKEADLLWKQLPSLSPGQILGRPDARITRADLETQLVALLSPALRELRSGRPAAAQKVELIQKAQTQLKQNVPPGLVYDHLLLNLSLQGKQ